jgi:hypothetical protein
MSTDVRPTPAQVHFRKVVQAHTVESLGICQYLNNCGRMSTCRMIHYRLDDDERTPAPATPAPSLGYGPRPNATTGGSGSGSGGGGSTVQVTCQWVNLDVRRLDPAVFGTFGVLMADPPWFIHQKARRMRNERARQRERERQRSPAPMCMCHSVCVCTCAYVHAPMRG